jgi:hypothetical protein
MCQWYPIHLLLLLLHLALQPWVSLGLLDNQSSVEFGRWENTAVRYSSLCKNTRSDTPECPEQHDVKISTASCNPASIGLWCPHTDLCHHRSSLNAPQLLPSKSPPIIFPPYWGWLLGFWTTFFLWDEVVSLMPNWRARVPLSLDSTFWPFRHGWPYR